jgi:competence protein ComEA
VRRGFDVALQVLVARARPCAMQYAGVATPAERKALAFLAAIAALGVAVRGVRANRERRADGVAALARQIVAVDSASAAQVARKRQPSRSRPSGRPPTAAAVAPATRVDLDEAGVDEIEAIPGIGPTLAARIVDDRARRGPFGSLAGLQRVKGIGPALAGRIDRYVRFSHPLAAPPVVIEFPKIRPRPRSP